MTDLVGAAAKMLCLKLLHSETEEEVVQILQGEGLWSDRGAWQPYGSIPNNRGIVGNQQSSPVAALVEKIVNSIDAVLVAECYRNSIDPTSPDAPQSMLEAVELFFDVKSGQIQLLRAGERTELASQIQLVATGEKTRPNYLIIDEGEGQMPDHFPTTFLSLLRDNKTRIPFVQGKYNMGGTGVLQFAGTNSFQLIISKRQPDIPFKESTRSSPAWGFTLVRRMDPGPDQPQSTYVYLAPHGVIPSFEADDLPLRPGRFPDSYGLPLGAGTCIKIWNYKIRGGLRTLATLDLRYALEEYLQAPALPIRICERRGYVANSYETTMSGLASVLYDSPQDIEPGFDTGSPLDVPDVGRVGMRIVVLRESADSRRYPSGVFFNVNGQLHGQLGSDFIARRTNFRYIDSSMIVMIDCSSLPVRTREDLFMASRDRLRQCDERTAIEDSVISYLKDHAGLKELNARRRQERLKSELSEEETEKVMQDLVKADPTLASLFGKGKRLQVPTGPLEPPAPYAGRDFPTIFRLRQEPKGGLVKQCPRNRTCRVDFETDASNDYFSRVNEPGRLELEGSPRKVSVHLWRGKATLRVAPPSGCAVGDRLNVAVRVTDTSRSTPFESRFTLVAEPEAPDETPEEPTERPPTGASGLTGLPHILEIRRDQWDQNKFTEHTAISLKPADDGTIDVLINMDNLHLRNEILKRKDTSPELLYYWFKYGIMLLAMGMLYRERQRTSLGSTESESGEAEAREVDMNQISISCQGLAITVIPVISGLGKGIIHAE